VTAVQEKTRQAYKLKIKSADALSDDNGILLINSPDSIRRDFEKKYAAYAEYAPTFSKRAWEYMKRDGWTYDYFENRTYLSKRIFYAIKDGKNITPTPETVIAICIGLRLGAHEREELMDLAGYRYKSTKELYAFSAVFDYFTIKSVPDFNVAYAALMGNPNAKPLTEYI